MVFLIISNCKCTVKFLIMVKIKCGYAKTGKTASNGLTIYQK